MEPRARDQAPRWQPAQGPAQRGWGERPVGRGGPQQRRGSGRAEPGPGRAAAALHRPRRAENPSRSDRPDAAPGRAGREGLVTPALWLLVALQSAAPPDVTAQVDRARVPAGEELTLTIRARSRSAEPVALTLPGLTGFTIVASREVTEVTLEGVGGPVRTMTREVRLSTQRPGTLVIGPVRVRQGLREIATPPLTVTVDSAAAGLATAVSPIARRLIEAAPPPAHNDRVALSLILPGDSVLVGQQLDVIAAAWFPRELRTRLSYPPILSLQTAEGAWSYPGAVPTEVAASRQVRGGWMDLFVAHQALFPLAPGRIVIPPATVAYAVPVGFSLFKREERYSLRSDTVPVTVLPLPAGRRPAEQPVAGQGLAPGRTLDPRNRARGGVSVGGRSGARPRTLGMAPVAARSTAPRLDAASPRDRHGRRRQRAARDSGATHPAGPAGAPVSSGAGESRAGPAGPGRRWVGSRVARGRSGKRGRRAREAPAGSPARVALRSPGLGGCGRACGRAGAGTAGVRGRTGRERAPGGGGNRAHGAG